MKNIMKFEIDKTANNISFLVTTMITIIIMGCIFFTGFHYSQLSLSLIHILCLLEKLFSHLLRSFEHNFINLIR